MEALVTGTAASPRARDCVHESTRVDGSLDDHCLRCGIAGYWHAGHRHDRPHPSGKILLTIECPAGAEV